MSYFLPLGVLGMAFWKVPEAQHFLEMRPHMMRMLNIGLQEEV